MQPITMKKKLFTLFGGVNTNGHRNQTDDTNLQQDIWKFF